MKRLFMNMLRALRNAALLVAGAVAALRRRRAHRPAAGEPRAEEERGEDRDGEGRFHWKRRLRTIGGFLAVVAVVGFLIAASGIAAVKATEGHWAVTRWVLNWAMARSVSTNSIGIEAPLDSLDNLSLIVKGAAHYESGCRPCHGSPTLRNPRITQQMTPYPPYLPEVIPEWEPDELFYIVKYGVKFTGMPAWPAQTRNDEVWAMVAFLLKYPDLSAEEYRRLVTGDAPLTRGTTPLHALLSPEGEVPRAVIESCARCHGVNGMGRGTGAFPRLAGQSPTYLYASLRAFARGERHSGIMEPIAAGLSEEQMRELARYYGSLEEPTPSPALPEAERLIELGEAIARRGLPSQGVPSCIDCHGPGPQNPFYPMLAGQYADYLFLQLKLFKQEDRGGTTYAHIMRPIADRLTPEQMRAVSLFYESLAADEDRPAP